MRPASCRRTKQTHEGRGERGDATILLQGARLTLLRPLPLIAMMIGAWSCGASEQPGRGGDGGGASGGAGGGGDDGGGGGGGVGAGAGAGAAGDAVPLCDGSATLRLRRYVEPQGVREFPGSLVRSENGRQSLVIDGTCHYWLNGGWGGVPGDVDSLGWRRGVLDEATAKAIEAAVPLAGLDRLVDCKGPLPSEDAPMRAIRSPLSYARCRATGEAFDRAFDFLGTIGARLWAEALPVEGAMHVVAVPVYSEDEPVAYDWPLKTPVADFYLPSATSDSDPSFEVGVSRLVSDAADAAALRAFREAYLADDAKGIRSTHPGPLVADGRWYAIVYLRDALPYEDARGLLPSE